MTYRIWYWQRLFNGEGMTRHYDIPAASDSEAQAAFDTFTAKYGRYAPGFRPDLPRLEKVTLVGQELKQEGT